MKFLRFFIVICIATSAAGVNAAWEAPVSFSTNTTPPVDTGALGQIKQGALQINGNLSVVKGRVGLGILEPLSNFLVDVFGKVSASQYCDRAGGHCATFPGAGITNQTFFTNFVLLFDGECPAQWERIGSAAGRMPVGRDVTHVAGAQYEGHSHSYSVTVGGYVSGGGNRVNLYPVKVTPQSTFPPYTNLVACRKK